MNFKSIYFINNVKMLSFIFVYLFFNNFIYSACPTCSSGDFTTAQSGQTVTFNVIPPNSPAVDYYLWDIGNTSNPSDICWHDESFPNVPFSYVFPCFYGNFTVTLTIVFQDGGGCCTITKNVFVNPYSTQNGTNSLWCSKIVSINTTKPKVKIYYLEPTHCEIPTYSIFWPYYRNAPGGIADGGNFYIGAENFPGCVDQPFTYRIWYYDNCGREHCGEIINNRVGVGPPCDVYSILFGTCVIIKAEGISSCCLPSNYVRYYSFTASSSFPAPANFCTNISSYPYYDLSSTSPPNYNWPWCALNLSCSMAPPIVGEPKNKFQIRSKSVNSDGFDIQINDHKLILLGIDLVPIGDVKIFDITGNLIHHEMINNNVLELGRDLIPGVYCLRVKVYDTYMSRKFVIYN